MHILVAPDSFKGSCSALAAAEALGEGLKRGWEALEPELLPLADGGEGTVEALVAATGGELRSARVRDPLGRPIEATFGLLGDGQTAVIEMAAASGLPLLQGNERNPLETTTLGTGDLIRAALETGCKRIILGIGGSATTDCGVGMATALGARFLKADGTPIEPTGKGLLELDTFDLSGLDARLQSVEILVASDVTNPLYGPQGAAYVYAPQKGATPEQVELLDKALKHCAEIVERQLHKRISGLPGAGAAGGLGAGLMAFCNARLAPGADLILDVVEFERRLQHVALVVTGEGKLDTQTAFGKLPARVAARAKAQGVPTVAIAGSVDLEESALEKLGLSAAFALPTGPMSLQTAMARAPELLQFAGEQLARTLKLGRSLDG